MSHKACILLLNDNLTELATFEMKIKGLILPGDMVITSTSGEEAIEIIKARSLMDDRPCIFVLGLNMPGEKKGFDVLEWIRRRSEYDNCAVIILTTSNSREDEKKAMMLGADRYIIKPQKLIEVTPVLKSILKEYRDRTPGDPSKDSMSIRIDRAHGRG